MGKSVDSLYDRGICILSIGNDDINWRWFYQLSSALWPAF